MTWQQQQQVGYPLCVILISISFTCIPFYCHASGTCLCNAHDARCYIYIRIYTHIIRVGEKKALHKNIWLQSLFANRKATQGWHIIFLFGFFSRLPAPVSFRFVYNHHHLIYLYLVRLFFRFFATLNFAKCYVFEEKFSFRVYLKKNSAFLSIFFYLFFVFNSNF